MVNISKQSTKQEKNMSRLGKSAGKPGSGSGVQILNRNFAFSSEKER